jgi:hypothetical protein
MIEVTSTIDHPAEWKNAHQSTEKQSITLDINKIKRPV